MVRPLNDPAHVLLFHVHVGCTNPILIGVGNVYCGGRQLMSLMLAMTAHRSASRPRAG